MDCASFNRDSADSVFLQSPEQGCFTVWDPSDISNSNFFKRVSTERCRVPEEFDGLLRKALARAFIVPQAIKKSVHT